MIQLGLKILPAAQRAGIPADIPEPFQHLDQFMMPQLERGGGQKQHPVESPGKGPVARAQIVLRFIRLQLPGQSCIGVFQVVRFIHH